MHKGSRFFLLMFTVFILLPIAGITASFVRILIRRTFYSEEDIKKQKIPLKLILTAGIGYGVLLESYLFWMSWIAKFNIPQILKIVGLFASLPYLTLLFGVVYSVGPAITFGGGSTMRFFKYIVGKEDE